MWTRRSVLGALGAAGLAAVARAEETKPVIELREIPSTKEKIPAIGIGSYQTFDTTDAKSVQPVLERFLALGGRVIDSSPMYGDAEQAIGDMLTAIGADAKAAWVATKVWTEGKQKGVKEMQRSLKRLGRSSIELMQIHNLVDWKTQLATLREWKAAGTIKYIGVTHYGHSAFDELEAIVKTEGIDFVQLPYNVLDRAAEKRLLPAAKDKGAAVLVMEPFDSGSLFKKTKGTKLPSVATDLGCTSWAQLALKFLLGHPAVTCPIPATSKVKHVEDNLGALHGPYPTEKQRAAIVAALP
jgi:diketogulonate reductase-like aldo/keto reductase